MKSGLQGYCRECCIKVIAARQRAYVQHNLELGRPAAQEQTCSQCKYDFSLYCTLQCFVLQIDHAGTLTMPYYSREVAIKRSLVRYECVKA